MGLVSASLSVRPSVCPVAVGHVLKVTHQGSTDADRIRVGRAVRGPILFGKPGGFCNPFGRMQRAM